MKVIIAGGRDFCDYAFLKEQVDWLLSGNKEVEIVSGGANGADKLGEQYAKENNIPVKIFKAEWDKFGKTAGPMRNKEMADYATHCILFWDGKSKGTKDMMRRAKEKGLNLIMFKYKAQ